MKTNRQTTNVTRQIINACVAMAFLLTCSLASDASAQSFSFGVDPATLAPAGASNTPDYAVGLTTPVLATMNSAAWKDLRREHDRALDAADVEVRGRAIQNILYLQRFYPEQSKVRRLSSDLYEVSRLDNDDRIRIMALHALHAIGNENIMRQLAQDVQLEASPRVRKTMIAVVNDHFGKQPG